jgi:hypothetical protein
MGIFLPLGKLTRVIERSSGLIFLWSGQVSLNQALCLIAWRSRRLTFFQFEGRKFR